MINNVYHYKKIKGHFKPKEHKPPIVNQQNVVYHYKCGLCDTDYVGSRVDTYINVLMSIKALANGFNICFNIYSILLNAVGRLLNDVERGMSKRFQHFIQQNLASGLVISFRSQLFSRLRHARAPFRNNNGSCVCLQQSSLVISSFCSFRSFES